MTDAMNQRIRESYNKLPYTSTMEELEERIKALVYENHKLIQDNQKYIEINARLVEDYQLIDSHNLSLKEDNQRLQLALGEAMSQRNQLKDQLTIMRAADEESPAFQG
jgi:predicted RNase H-like nuclease (RuvC/YqgF family)